MFTFKAKEYQKGKSPIFYNQKSTKTTRKLHIISQLYAAKVCQLFCNTRYAGGELHDDFVYSDDVLEFDAEKGVWNKIGSMSTKTIGHALSVIKYEDIKAYCN